MNPLHDPYADREQSQIKHIILESYLGAFTHKILQWADGLVHAIRRNGPKCFPFVLVDPKGWKGFSLSSIAPLIQLQPCEVLVNFMTGHIQRFIRADHLTIKEGFRRLYDSDEYADRLANLSGQDREDAMVFSYAERLAEVGGYPFVSIALVQNPTVDRTYYHLVYATRHIKGIEVFKAAERKALTLAPTLRAKAKNRRQEAKTGQSSLFSPEDLPDTDHLLKLQAHFEEKAGDALRARLEQQNEVSYEDLYVDAMRFPIVQEPFLRNWLADHARPISNPEGIPKIGLNFRFCAKPRG